MNDGNCKSFACYVMTSKGLAFLSGLSGPALELVSHVVTAPDRALRCKSYDAILDFCEEKGIKVFRRGMEPDPKPNSIVVAVSWKWIIDISEIHLLILHDSLLPKLRGFNPLVTALISAEERLGVSLIRGAESYDSGDIICQASTVITYPIKICEAIRKLETCYRNLAHVFSSWMLVGDIPKGTPQAEVEATYSVWRDEEDYLIDWSQSAAQISRFINAVGYPYRGAACYLNDVLFRISDAREIADMKIINRDSGKVIRTIDGFPVVICGTGLLKIIELEDELGRNALPLRSFRVRFSSAPSRIDKEITG